MTPPSQQICMHFFFQIKSKWQPDFKSAFYVCIYMYGNVFVLFFSFVPLQIVLFLFFSVRLVGDILICTGFLSYSGPFNQDFRLLLNKNWMKELNTRKIPFSKNLNMVDMLVDPTTVRIPRLTYKYM